MKITNGSATDLLKAASWTLMESEALVCTDRSVDVEIAVEGRLELRVFGGGRYDEVGLLRVDGDLALGFHYPEFASDGRLIADHVVDFRARPGARRAIRGPIAVFDGPRLRLEVELGPEAWAFVTRDTIEPSGPEWDLHTNELIVVDGDHALSIGPEPMDVVGDPEDSGLAANPEAVDRIRAGHWVHVFLTT